MLGRSAFFMAIMIMTKASGDIIEVSAVLPSDFPAGTTRDFGISLSNNTDTDAVEDLFAGYQIVLELVPVTATGTLSFQDAVIAASYIFPTNLGIATAPLGSGDLVRVSDSKLPITADGEQVSMAAMDLFTIPVMASSDASGTWIIRAVSDVGKTSEWTDSSRDQALAREFLSLPISSSLNLGTFAVTAIPEPSPTLSIFIVLGLSLLMKKGLALGK